MVEHMRAWPHHRHITYQYVKKLWQLIQARPSHKSTYFSYPAIVARGLPFIGIAIHIHTPELIAFKGIVIVSRPLLGKKHAPPGFQLYQDGQYGEQPAKHKQDDENGKYDIEASLDGPVQQVFQWLG